MGNIINVNAAPHGMDGLAQLDELVTNYFCGTRAIAGYERLREQYKGTAIGDRLVPRIDASERFELLAHYAANVATLTACVASALRSEPDPLYLAGVNEVARLFSKWIGVSVRGCLASLER